MNIADKLEVASSRILDAFREHKPIAVCSLFSGGHDSLSALSAALKSEIVNNAVHINTGIGIEATRTFVRETCRKLSIRLIELKAVENVRCDGSADPQLYQDLVMKYGFPGPAGHNLMYQRLKERALARLARMYGASTRGKLKRRIMLVSGCRSQESVRRMGNVEPVQVTGRFIWVNPIHDWTKLDTSDLIEHMGWERNIIVDLIHKSGECLCGAFAKPGELEELNLWPQTRPAYNEIKALECEVRASGHCWGWGERPPRKVSSKIDSVLPLCWSCDKDVSGPD